MQEPGGSHRDYDSRPLIEDELGADPLVAYRRWLDEAEDAGLPEPGAVTLATVDGEGRPDARIVLLRGIDAEGVVFYTNRRSTKGEQLAVAPHAAVVSYWDALHRQVRLRGRVRLLEDATSDAYFATRPRPSQLAAWASDQSYPIDDRDELDRRVAELDRCYADGEVPRPPHWGGYRIDVQEVEFWQGRPARLHERLRYCRQDPGGWDVVRLQP